MHQPEGQRACVGGGPQRRGRVEGHLDRGGPPYQPGRPCIWGSPSRVCDVAGLSCVGQGPKGQHLGVPPWATPPASW